MRIPMYCTAVGKAMLAYYKPEYIAKLCREFDFHHFTENTLTTPKALLAELGKVRTQGYAVDNLEHNTVLYFIAVPLLDLCAFPLAAVSVSVPAFRFRDDPGIGERCIKSLQGATGALTEAILT